MLCSEHIFSADLLNSLEKIFLLQYYNNLCVIYKERA